MSALPPKADIGTQRWNVRFVPKADITQLARLWLFDHLAGANSAIAEMLTSTLLSIAD
jgi:hypothetical protein